MTMLSKYTFDRSWLGFCLRKQTAFLGMKAIRFAIFQLCSLKKSGKKWTKSHLQACLSYKKNQANQKAIDWNISNILFVDVIE